MPFATPLSLPAALAGGLALLIPLLEASPARGAAAGGTGCEEVRTREGERGHTLHATRRMVTMGTRADLLVHASSRAAALQALEAATGALEAADALLSTWDETTPLSALNRAEVGTRVPVPARLVEELRAAFAWSERTEGAFDPRVGPLIDVWGVRTGGRTPTPAELHRARAASGPGSVRLEPDDAGATRMREGAWIDAGGFGKGAALRDARAALLRCGVRSAVIDLGGQVLVMGGGRPDADAWELAVADPRERGRAASRLLLADASAATSGTSERGLHVLDPRTGRPVPAWGSVTVVAPDPLAADVVSTALYVMGPAAGMEWARHQDALGVLFLVIDGAELRPLWNPAMERWLAPAAGSFSTPTSGTLP